MVKSNTKSETVTRTIEITVETIEALRVRPIPRVFVVWCRECEREVKMLPPEDAAQVTGVSTRWVYSGIEAGSTHFVESSDGNLMVCLHSVSEIRDKSQHSKGGTNQP